MNDRQRHSRLVVVREIIILFLALVGGGGTEVGEGGGVHKKMALNTMMTYVE